LHAIFPAIAALVAIYGFFTDPASISSQVDKLSGVLPSGALDVIRNQMNLVACQGQTKLGVTVMSALSFPYGSQTRESNRSSTLSISSITKARLHMLEMKAGWPMARERARFHLEGPTRASV
jgi:uncharacterized BrkB/YihY/UPF0761 family membrane protein